MAELPASYVPTHALHPGRELAEELEARGISADDLATDIEHPAAAIRALLAEQQPMTRDLASAVERALGIDAQFWLNLQALHDQIIERRAAMQLDAEVD